jgi:hypothetical protein
MDIVSSLFFKTLKKQKNIIKKSKKPKKIKNQKSKKRVLLFKVASQLLFYTRTIFFLHNIALKY